MSSPKLHRRAASGGKRYCVLCKHYENKVLDDGTKITLHRLPGGKSQSEVLRRKAWLRGLKLHRPDLPITDNTRLCILHFEHKTYNKRESVPKFFNLERCKTQEVKARRPLIPRDSINTVSICSHENVGTDLTTMISETKSLPDQQVMPEILMDTLDSCETIELEETSTNPPTYVKFSAHLLSTDHDYYSLSNMEETQKTRHCTTQTSPIESPYCSMKPEDIKDNDEKTKFYTGFPNYATFLLFFQTFLQHGAYKLTYWEGQKRSVGAENRKYNLETISKPGRKRRLRPLDEFYMVCVRLRLGLLQDHLADLFKVSVMTVSRIMNTWINFMYDHMKSLIPWPSRDQIMANLPKCFTDMPQVRIVIDATEFFCEKPSSLVAQNLTWSEYKHHNTFKVLIGVAPNGLVTFISRVWGGHTSDRHIVQKDGNLFIPLMEPGDVVLADKGFTVADLLPPHIGLNMPPFISKSKQMSKNQFF